MASSMATFRQLSLTQTLKKLCPSTYRSFIIINRYASSNTVPAPTEVSYPPIKPKYPPGVWDNLTTKRAWDHHEAAKELNRIPKVKERLEHIAGETPIPIFQNSTLNVKPGSADYNQYMTKTHVVEGLPTFYDTERGSNPLSETQYDNIKSLLTDTLLQEHEYHNKYNERDPITSTNPRSCQSNEVLGQMLLRLLGGLSYNNPHLLRSQFDTDVRLETFWRRSGFDKEGISICGRIKEDDDIRWLQLKTKVQYQLRSEQPLPEFVPMSDAICEGSVSEFPYSPLSIGLPYEWDRPITVSGHWVGDPCEFASLTVKVLGEDYKTFVERYGEEKAIEETINVGLMTGFGSTLAQAHNQGFNTHWEVTYPFTNQCIVTDGKMFRFIAYQLNTLQMWRPDSGYPKRNLMWYSKAMPLYEVIENEQVKGLNDDVVKLLLDFVLLKPRERVGVDLRPYLPEEEAPGLTKKYINHVGEEPIEQPVIGRFQYPRNAVYF